jgi:hypothetical protein
MSQPRKRFVSSRVAALANGFVLLAGVALFAASTNPWQQEQSLPIQLGTSGGNVNNISKAFCCSGTLGSLIKDASGNEYILSNNHILADTDTSTNTGGAPEGDDVSQPGLVDVGCTINSSDSHIVAHVSNWVPLGTHNVDAAIAGTTSADTTDEILGIGPVSATTGTPTVREGVAKSGRTTQLTCASVSSIETTVKVQYQTGCGSGKKFTLLYTGQVAVNGSSFSAAGDSGSLIVDQNSVEPVALLFAGSSTVTIANPASDVLSGLSAVSSPSTRYSFVGTANPKAVSCPAGAPVAPAHGHASQASLQRALEAKRAHEQQLLADPAIIGVGVGESTEDSAEAVVLIYVEQGRPVGPIPDELDGVRTEVVRTEAFRAYGWNEREHQSCVAK